MLDTLLRIRLFVAVYEERSFTGAAMREHATQSGVTQHMQKLEEHLGVKLFVRGSGSVKPTPAGDLYYEACLKVLRVHAEARMALQPLQRRLVRRGGRRSHAHPHPDRARAGAVSLRGRASQCRGPRHGRLQRHRDRQGTRRRARFRCRARRPTRGRPAQQAVRAHARVSGQQRARRPQARARAGRATAGTGAPQARAAEPGAGKASRAGGLPDQGGCSDRTQAGDRHFARRTRLRGPVGLAFDPSGRHDDARGGQG